ncbi:hypothetical protein LNK20_21395, partial [Bacillus safensis]|uniref:hypothetical protein n=1 Tax=Bacillus safensis TaxID=561879 RepID=UPI001FFA178C
SDAISNTQVIEYKHLNIQDQPVSTQMGYLLTNIAGLPSLDQSTSIRCIDVFQRETDLLVQPICSAVIDGSKLLGVHDFL